MWPEVDEILGSPNRRLRLDGLRMLRRGYDEKRESKGRPAAGGGDALASNSGGERRTRLAIVLVEKTTRKNSQETVDRRGFIERMGTASPATPNSNPV